MNDITALAQREKFEAWAEEVGALPWGRLKKQRNTSGGYSLQVYTYMWKAWQAANAELVEALEKARQQNGHIREQSAEWERKAISNFEECVEMSARIEELEAQRKLAFTACNRWRDKCAELESRTVTVKLPDLRKIVSGDRYVWSDGAFNYSQDVKAALTAAGIKWEAE